MTAEAVTLAVCAEDWWPCLAPFLLVETCFGLFLKQFSAQAFPTLDEKNTWLARD